MFHLTVLLLKIPKFSLYLTIVSRLCTVCRLVASYVYDQVTAVLSSIIQSLVLSNQMQEENILTARQTPVSI